MANKPDFLAEHAVKALIDEAMLTPKPGLVDKNNSGAHKDLNLNLMLRSANALYETFWQIAEASSSQLPTKGLWKKLSQIGLKGEETMFKETGGINTHKGAIWALGLLVCGAAMASEYSDTKNITTLASKIACYNHISENMKVSNGFCACENYGVTGARGEAKDAFPHVINFALPSLYASRKQNASEHNSRLNALMALIATVDDTCILHRGGMNALIITKKGAKEVIDNGGTSTRNGFNSLIKLDKTLMKMNVSPGGSADLLASTLFLDSIKNRR
ncbi:MULTISPECIES: triphosphoribosyl-dephospho-CoA synthase [Clostridium]|uniref:triphosphoribosyl-dephospho-CoA synthase n=1 Tax=Clostridium TaxID=1485 RepID=UPI000825B05B|nr:MULTISPECIES: triphosphoribosyl-dephospho-CoA synthase [Clostridium]PJI06868.1 triphosphoribosyl-dephospho-CoA synthase [Clostridium sp. CT7]